MASIIIAVWIFFNMLNFISTDIDEALLFDRMGIIGALVPVVFFLIAYFFSQENIVFPKKITVAIIFSILPFTIFSSTEYNVKALTTAPECAPIVGNLYWFTTAFVVFYIGWTLIVFLKKYKSGDSNVKKQIKIIMIGFGVAVLWGTVTNLIAPMTGYASVALVAPIGILFLFLSIAYVIVRYQFLNIKLIATQALVIALVILIGSELFFAENFTNKILIIFTLLITAGMGWALVRSVKEEVKRKEELQVMSDRLAVANDQMKKLDRAKNEFVSRASHDLRTPITGLKGYVSMLEEGSYGEVTPAQKETLRKTFTIAEGMLGFVEDLLNASKIESEGMSYDIGKWKIEDILEQLTETLYPKAKDLGLYLDYKKPEVALPELTIDGKRVKEAISNLVDNAIKYSKKGGVTVKLERGESSNYKPQVTSNPDEKFTTIEGPVARITISDTGIGIPKDEIPYLFAKFSRGKDTTRLNAAGTGLGLYICKGFIEGNGGKIWVESEGDGKGSKFIVELPIA